MPAPLTLTAGKLVVQVDPALGGRVTRFARDDVELFVPVDPARSDPTLPVSGGCYPLVPWSNRIRDARFSHAGREVRLVATETGAGHAIHGHGSRRAWRLDQAADAVGESLRLSCDVPAGEEGWPWAYRAEQLIHLGADGLSITLACRNAGEAPMPVGLGLHPYFPRHGDVGLWFRSDNAWPPVDGKFPTGATGVPERLDFSEPAPVVDGLDQGFGGWDGMAHVIWPELGLALEMTAGAGLDHLIVYTPAGREHICVEPVSHAIDAFNLADRDVPGAGARTLPPGHRFAVTVRFTVHSFE